MTTNNSIIFRAEYQEMLDGLRKIEPAWESVQKALKELNQLYSQLLKLLNLLIMHGIINT